MREINSLLPLDGGGVPARCGAADEGAMVEVEERSIRAGPEADLGKPVEEEKKSPRGWEPRPEVGAAGFMALKPSRSEKFATGWDDGLATKGVIPRVSKPINGVGCPPGNCATGAPG